jgi:hypothetical protein
MSSRHRPRQSGGLLGQGFAKKLAAYYGREGCRLPRSERLALLERELSILEAEGVKPFDPRAAWWHCSLS